MKMKWNLVLTLVVGMLLVQTSAMAVSLGPGPELMLQQQEQLADEDPPEDVAACMLVGTYAAPFSCQTGQHEFTEGMTHELTGLSVSDFNGVATSTMRWTDGETKQKFTLSCEWAYAAGDTAPFCTTSGTQPDVGTTFDHHCSIGRATAGVAVCSIRVDPTV